MMMVFREEDPLPNTPLPQLIPWELLRAIAIVQLHIEERFIEPPSVKKMPFSLLFQQTLSILSSSGELTPKELANRILSLPPFLNVSREDYKLLLTSMLRNEYIQLTEEKGLIVGLAPAEQLQVLRRIQGQRGFHGQMRVGRDRHHHITSPRRRQICACRQSLGGRGARRFKTSRFRQAGQRQNGDRLAGRCR